MIRLVPLRARPAAVFITLVAPGLILSSDARAQDPPETDGELTVEQERELREETERRLRELELKFDAMSEDVERFQLSKVVSPVGESYWGLGPAASKVYARDQGLSIGGYGELRYRNFDDADDEIDFTRAVLYFGYKFNESWVFNSEIEVEHADEIFLEFAYVDYLHTDQINFRGGLLLAPMGLINEVHEPTTYLPANRPLTESFIIPSTWRENGAGLFGDAGGFDYKAYVMGGLDGTEFGGPSGLRGGRQKGSTALAEDFGLVLSANWTDTPGLLVGGSVYTGDSGQSQGQGSMDTQIYEAHVDYKAAGFWGRALISEGHVGDRDAGDLDLSGWYIELGYDVLRKHEKMALYPYVRYEDIDTDVSAGGIDDTAATYGLHYRPIDQIVFKLDYTDFSDDQSEDVTTFLIGYVF